MPRSVFGAGRQAGSARRMFRRRLALAPRAVGLMTCSLALAVGGVSAYGLTVPSLVAAHGAREPHIAHATHGDLGSTTGYVWADVFSRTVLGDDSTGLGAGDEGTGKDDDEVELSDGTVIRLTSVKHVTQLVQAQNSVKNLVANAANGTAAGGTGGGDKKGTDTGTGSGNHTGSNSASGGSSTGSGGSVSGGSGSSSGSGGNSGSGLGSGGSSGGSSSAGGLSDAQEESIHSWLVAKYNMLDGYVSRANAAVATYGSTGDASACDSLGNEIFSIRAEFGRQTFSPQSKWYQQYAKLWGCYTNLGQWVGHYGDDDVALGNFSNNMAALAL